METVVVADVGAVVLAPSEKPVDGVVALVAVESVPKDNEAAGFVVVAAFCPKDKPKAVKIIRKY